MTTLSTQDEVRAAYKAGDKTVEMIVTTQSSNLNLRNKPDKSGAVLISVPKGKTVNAFDAARTITGWRAVYYVMDDQKKVFGFCSADYLTGASVIEAATPAEPAAEGENVAPAEPVSNAEEVQGGASFTNTTGGSATW